MRLDIVEGHVQKENKTRKKRLTNTQAEKQSDNGLDCIRKEKTCVAHWIQNLSAQQAARKRQEILSFVFQSVRRRCKEWRIRFYPKVRHHFYPQH